MIINGKLRKRIVTTFIEDIGGKKPDTLIEGIGSLRFGLGFKELMNEGNDMVVRGKVYCLSVNNIQEYNYNNSACAPIWPTNIDAIETGNLIQVSPNPFSNTITIMSPEVSVVKVYNVTGICIYNGLTIVDEKLKIQTQNWASGLYIIGIQSEKGSHSFKVTKY